MHKIGGLSPLARGTRAQVVLRRLHHRFIPAGAGNTRATITKGSRVPVYPRWRGEHTFDASDRVAETGLSPLARGTLNLRTGQLPVARFIPAGAGNTTAKEVIGYIPQVYPRWRGEHLILVRG